MTYPLIDSCLISSRSAQLVVIRHKDLSKFCKN